MQILSKKKLVLFSTLVVLVYILFVTVDKYYCNVDGYKVSETSLKVRVCLKCSAIKNFPKIGRYFNARYSYDHWFNGPNDEIQFESIKYKYVGNREDLIKQFYQYMHTLHYEFNWDENGESGNKKEYVFMKEDQYLHIILRQLPKDTVEIFAYQDLY